MVIRTLTLLLLLFSSINAFADEVMLSCDGDKTMHFRADSEIDLDGKVTFIINGTKLETDYGVSAELLEKDDFSYRWKKVTPGQLQHWELNTISGLLMHHVNFESDDGDYEPFLVHVYYCHRVDKRITD